MSITDPGMMAVWLPNRRRQWNIDENVINFNVIEKEGA
jgi:hypothetical protein